jgi:cytochrome c peroxidase
MIRAFFIFAPSRCSLYAKLFLGFRSVRILRLIAGSAFLCGAVGTAIARDDVSHAFPLGLPPGPGRGADGAAIAELGRLLFYDKALSSDGTISCASCHDPALGFSGPEPVGRGIGGARGTRHPPSLLNLYLDKSFMLDGRAPSLEAQIHIPLESGREMNIAWPAALARLQAQQAIMAAASAAREQPLTKDAVLRAIPAFLRRLVSAGSPFDRYYYLGDESAISEEAKEGLKLFVRKGRCSGCHLITGYSAPLTDGSFHSVGIGFAGGDYSDVGRFAVTGQVQDRGAFKTPTLRNVALRKYFMHDGSMSSLRGVLDYYNKGGNAGAANLDGRVRALHLSPVEEDALIAFLGTLTAPVCATACGQ